MTKKRKSRKAPTPLMDVDRRVRARLRTHEAQYEHVFEPNVPISQIELPKPWHELRYKDNLYLIKTTGAVPPIFLFLNEKTNKYRIANGIHRTHVVKNLGYTCIPAVITRKKRRRKRK